MPLILYLMSDPESPQQGSSFAHQFLFAVQHIHPAEISEDRLSSDVSALQTTGTDWHFLETSYVDTQGIDEAGEPRAAFAPALRV
jgi:hypothetical protein